MPSVIILAAGSGERLQLGYNKMFWKLKEKPLYQIVIDKFASWGFTDIILVVSEDDAANFDVNCKKVIGGKRRCDSVYQGLLAASCDDVLIHDGARPFVSLDVVENVIAELKYNEAVVVGKKVIDTIKDIEHGIKTLNRDFLVIVETPQAGRRKLLLDCYRKGLDEGFAGTDDMAYIEKYSHANIKFVFHEDANIKITRKEDLRYAEYLAEELKLCE